MKTYILLLYIFFLTACSSNTPLVNDEQDSLPGEISLADTSTPAAIQANDTTLPVVTKSFGGDTIHTGNTRRNELLVFAKSLMGTPYKYASVNPAEGFDCSGFITYVFNHFGILVPRSSVDFTNVGEPVALQKAQPGDLILFTGTDSATRIAGHMGIVTGNTDSIRFIHSSSGKVNGVTITALNNYYKGRFVKVISIFNN